MSWHIVLPDEYREKVRKIKKSMLADVTKLFVVSVSDTKIVMHIIDETYKEVVENGKTNHNKR